MLRLTIKFDPSDVSQKKTYELIKRFGRNASVPLSMLLSHYCRYFDISDTAKITPEMVAVMLRVAANAPENRVDVTASLVNVPKIKKTPKTVKSNNKTTGVSISTTVQKASASSGVSSDIDADAFGDDDDISESEVDIMKNALAAFGV